MDGMLTHEVGELARIIKAIIQENKQKFEHIPTNVFNMYSCVQKQLAVQHQ